MADGGDQFSARSIASIAEIGRTDWNALSNPSEPAYDPFISFEFLSALEESKSVGAEAGWVPAHVILENAGRTVGAAPLYLKGHSQGEYVFDHHWADAYERAGGRYYPKLVCAAPFTPVPGSRLLAANPESRMVLAASLSEISRRMGVSSTHVNFCTQTDEDALKQHEFMPRRGTQYHWFNRSYETFDDFLGALSSRKRKAVRRERRQATESGLAIKRLRGRDIAEEYWDAFWMFYQDTGARKWGHPYLTRTFFRLISETMQDRLLLIVAERNNQPVAGGVELHRRRCAVRPLLGMHGISSLPAL